MNGGSDLVVRRRSCAVSNREAALIIRDAAQEAALRDEVSQSLQSPGMVQNRRSPPIVPRTPPETPDNCAAGAI